jgi:hypothetical protein
MAVKNQYSELIPYSYFKEYKNGDEKKQKEVEDEVFNIIRSVNTFPLATRAMTDTLNSLRSLATMPACYDSVRQEYGINNNGIDILYDFYPNIWDVRKADCPISVLEGFFLDDKLRRGIRKTLQYSETILDLVRWMRMIGLGYVVNFRPPVAKSIYETYGPKKGCKVYDFASGYGGRMLGAWAAKNVTEYVSVDVNTETVANGQKLIEFLDNYFPNLDRNEVHLCGSEDFTIEKFPQYKGYFDIAFSSPQYFNTEIYSLEETQSCNKYPEYDKWVKNFLRPTLNNAIDVLKEDGYLGINIFEKLPNMKKIIVMLCEERGFLFFKQDKMLLRTMPGAGKRNEDGTYESRDTTIGSNYEPIFWFAHRDTLKDKGIKGYGVRDFEKIVVDEEVRSIAVPLSNGKRLKGNVK